MDYTVKIWCVSYFTKSSCISYSLNLHITDLLDTPITVGVQLVDLFDVSAPAPTSKNTSMSVLRYLSTFRHFHYFHPSKGCISQKFDISASGLQL